MHKKIIILTNGSEAGNKAAQKGIEFARFSGSNVITVYVADVIRLTHLSGCGEFSDIVRQEMIREGEKVTKHVETMAKDAGVLCERVVVVGNLADELRRIHHKEEIGLLVMSDNGCGGLWRFLQGNSTEKAARQIEIPVLMVPREIACGQHHTH